MNVGVYADAFGGMASVDFFVEGAVINVPSPSLNTELDPNGNPKNLPGYWITLDPALFTSKIAAGSFGALRIYARGNPSNAAIRPRVIGPITLYVSTADSDFDKTIGAGGDYATLKQAMAAQAAAGAKHAKFTYLANATVEMENADAGVEYLGSKSWTRVIAAPGKTVTFARTTPIFEDFYYKWWIYQHKLLQFEGAGIVLDYKNIAGIFSAGYSAGHEYGVRFYGCTIDNSIGTSNTNYWNRDARPEGLCNVGRQHYVEFCTIKHLPFPLLSAIHAFGNKIFDTSKGVATGCDFVAYNYVNGVKWPVLHKTQPVFSLTYTGSAASATMYFTGSGGGRVLHLAENGVDIATYALTGVNTGPYFKIEAITAHINGTVAGSHPGWAATNLSGIAGLNSVYMWTPPSGFNDGNSVWNYNAAPVISGAAPDGTRDLKNKVVGFATSIDYHVDFWQANGAHENVIIVGNVMRNIGFMNPLKGDGELKDFVFSENVWYQDGVESAQTAAFGADHGVYRNNTATAWTKGQGGVHVYPPTNGSVFCEVVQYAGYIDNSDYSNVTPIKNSYVDYLANLTTFSQHTGNILGTNLKIASPAQQVVNAAAGDFRPAPGGPLATNVKAKVDAFDGRAVARSATDAIGAWSVNTPAPTWPF